MKTMKGKIIAVLAVLLIAVTAYTVGAGATPAPRTTSAAPVLYSQDTVTSIYNAASPAVMEIVVTLSAGLSGLPLQQGQGSGFLVDTQGHILTNNHVVKGAATVRVLLPNGQTAEAKVVGTDPADDLALISVDPTLVAGVSPLQLGDSSLVRPGQMAIAIGNPYGLTDSITVGVISGLNRTVSGSGLTGMLQTDAAMNPGNSGGPLLDANGMVMGINTAIESPSTGAHGIGFAVPSNVARNVLPDLTAGKTITRPWLGISGTALTPTLAQTLGLSVNQGVYVVTVIASSPASSGGLKAGSTTAGGSVGDVITAVDGRSVSTVEDLRNYLNTRRVGDSVSLSILRGGNTTQVPATLAAWPDNISAGSTPQTPQPLPETPTPRGWRSR